MDQPGRARRLYSARRLQREQVVGAEVAAMDLQRGRVERAAGPAECFLGVEADAHDREPVIGGPAAHAARDVAQDFAGFGKADGNAVRLQQRPQPAHVAATAA